MLVPWTTFPLLVVGLRFAGTKVYNQTAGSFYDQESYITLAIEALKDLQPLKNDIQAALQEGEPKYPNLGELQPFDHHQPLQVAGYTIR